MSRQQSTASCLNSSSLLRSSSLFYLQFLSDWRLLLLLLAALLSVASRWFLPSFCSFVSCRPRAQTEETATGKKKKSVLDCRQTAGGKTGNSRFASQSSIFRAETLQQTRSSFNASSKPPKLNILSYFPLTSSSHTDVGFICPSAMIHNDPQWSTSQETVPVRWSGLIGPLLLLLFGQIEAKLSAQRDSLQPSGPSGDLL